MSGDLLNLIKSSKVHKEVISELNENNIVKPGNSVNNIIKYIETAVKNKIYYNQDKPLQSGCGFPANVSVNEVVAHYTSSPKNKDYILQQDDIVKVDFGVHSLGYITDSAQTFHFNSKFDEFIDISKKATNYAINLCGVDVNLGDLGKDIEEYVKSKEVTIDNKLYPLYTLKDLTGHNIGQYRIHKSKALPNTAIHYPLRMEEGEVFAVEPFISTCPDIYYDNPTNLFMINKNYINYVKNLSKKELIIFNKIFDRYSMLCFCDRWLLDEIENFNFDIFDNLIQKKLIEEYKTIYVPKNNYVSQFEHNIYIRKNGIIKLTENKYY